MEVSRELADSFAKRLATPYPLCYNPGLGVVERVYAKGVRVRNVWIRN